MSIRHVVNWVRGKKLPRVRAWDDLYPYKKIFVLQGFWELAQKGEVEFELVPYSYFEERGAPAPTGEPYRSHKNLVVLEIAFRDRNVNVAYDTNDLYYKIPNALLRWAHLYFKSNYQESYVRTGDRLHDAFWDSLVFRPEFLPERLDMNHAYKVLPCSFTMQMFDDFNRNRRWLKQAAGLWLRTPVQAKPHRLFCLGRWWEDRPRQDTQMTEMLFDQVRRLGLTVHGGIVPGASPLPAPYAGYAHPAVELDEWVRMCAQSQVSVMTRGLDGCPSFKALNFLMAGSPFIANELKANFWRPILPGVNYVAVKEDFSDMEDALKGCAPEALTEMGRRNLEHWENYISPEATARYILRTATQPRQASDMPAGDEGAL